MRQALQDIQNVQPAHGTPLETSCVPSQISVHRAQHDGQQQPASLLSNATAPAQSALRKVSINADGEGIVAAFVRDLDVHQPPAGQFTVTDIAWTSVKDHSQVALVAAIPADRLEDFISGESQRGTCTINIEDAGKSTKSLLRDDRAFCKFSATRKAQQQARQNVRASDAPQPYKPGTKARKNAIQKGTSCKLGCCYHFTIKQYFKCKDVAIIKFPSQANETSASCQSMKHCLEDGRPAHGDQEAAFHLREHTEEMKEFVLKLLRAKIKISIILERLKDEIERRLGVSEKSAQEIQAAVANSKYAADYFMKEHRLHNLRRKYCDVEWRLDNVDLVSCRMTYLIEEALPRYLRKWLYFYTDKEGNDVVLILQHPMQREWIIRFGCNQPLLMDATHGVNRYGLKLITIHIIDSHQKGRPVAFALVRHETAEKYVEFLKVVKESVEEYATQVQGKAGFQWNPSCILVDNSDAEINASRVVFLCIVVLLCIWHVKKAWLEQIKEKVTDYNRIKEISDLLNGLMHFPATGTDEEMDEAMFDEWSRIKVQIQDEQAVIKWFERTWIPKIRMWGICYRLYINTRGTNTTSYAEGFHSSFKGTTRAHGSEAKRVDHLAHDLSGPALAPYAKRDLEELDGTGKNTKLESLIEPNLQAACQFDPHRLCVVQEQRIDEGSESQVILHVLSKDLTEHKHTMRNPHKEYAACTCQVAINKQLVCKHQLAFLMQLAGDGNQTAAERLIYNRLGTRFQGDRDSVSLLADELVKMQSHAPASATNSQHTSGGSISQLDNAVSCDVADHEALLPSKTPMGLQAVQNAEDECLNILTQAFETIRLSNETARRSQVNLARAKLLDLQVGVDKLTSAPPITSAQNNYENTRIGRYRRQLGRLEKADRSRKTRQRTDDEPLSNVQHASAQPQNAPQNFLHATDLKPVNSQMRKGDAWKKHNSASGAAQHIQDCALQQASRRPKQSQCKGSAALSGQQVSKRDPPIASSGSAAVSMTASQALQHYEPPANIENCCPSNVHNEQQHLIPSTAPDVAPYYTQHQRYHGFRHDVERVATALPFQFPQPYGPLQPVGCPRLTSHPNHLNQTAGAMQVDASYYYNRSSFAAQGLDALHPVAYCGALQQPESYLENMLAPAPADQNMLYRRSQQAMKYLLSRSSV